LAFTTNLGHKFEVGDDYGITINDQNLNKKGKSPAPANTFNRDEDDSSSSDSPTTVVVKPKKF